MSLLKKLYHDMTHTFANKQGGWVKDKEDPRDYKFSDYFGADIFGAVIPESFRWANEKLPRVSFQDSTPSCVCNSFTFVNGFNSKREGNDVFLSWRYLYANVTQYSGGTSFRDNGDYLRNSGQCIDSEMPESEYYLALNQSAEIKRITAAMKEHALTYRIKNYFYIGAYNKTEIKVAVMKAPVIIGIYSNNAAWSKDIIKYDGNEAWGHAICLIGWTKDFWIITDWQGDGTFRKLDINHPISSAITVLDMPDDSIDKIMLKTYKSENKPEIWAILPNGERFHVVSWPQYQEGLRTKLWSDYTLKTEEQMKEIFDMYPGTKNPPAFLL